MFSSATDASSLRVKEVMTALREPASSLQFDRGDVIVPPDLDNPIGRTMLRMMGFENKRTKLLHSAQRLYGAVAEQMDTGALQQAFDTGKLFWGTYVLLSLHVWMLLRRLQRVDGLSPSDLKFLRQQIYNEFQRDVDHRVYAAGVQVGVSKWLRKLELHFYETAYEFDQALVGSFPPGYAPDPSVAGIPPSFEPTLKGKLAEVMQRKYYGGEDKHSIDADLLAQYTLREMRSLALTDEVALLRGHVRFTAGGGDLAGALRRAGYVPRATASVEGEEAGLENQDLGAPAPMRDEESRKGLF